MVTVNVWYPKGGNIGHGSVIVGNEYISNWPGELSSIIISGRGQTNTYQQDLESEGGSPDFVRKINTLNEDAMIKWWSEFKKDPKYSIYFLNCMQTAGMGLCIGSPNPLHNRLQAVAIAHHLKLMMFADMLAISPWLALPPIQLPL